MLIVNPPFLQIVLLAIGPRSLTLIIYQNTQNKSDQACLQAIHELVLWEPWALTSWHPILVKRAFFNIGAELSALGPRGYQPNKIPPSLRIAACGSAHTTLDHNIPFCIDTRGELPEHYRYPHPENLHRKPPARAGLDHRRLRPCRPRHQGHRGAGAAVCRHAQPQGRERQLPGHRPPHHAAGPQAA